MIIKTKHSIGDSLYILHQGKAICHPVRFIRTKSGETRQPEFTKVIYDFYISTTSGVSSYSEDQVFLTKEELIASL